MLIETTKKFKARFDELTELIVKPEIIANITAIMEIITSFLLSFILFASILTNYKRLLLNC